MAAVPVVSVEDIPLWSTTPSEFKDRAPVEAEVPTVKEELVTVTEPPLDPLQLLAAQANDPDPVSEDGQKAEEDKKEPQEVRFPYSPDANGKVALWEGELQVLDVDAVVIATSENLQEVTGIPGIIHTHAGPGLLAECQREESVRTGEARMTGGFNLPARHVIHTVGPRFNVKYQTAAENALHNCYRGSLQLLHEAGLKTIAFSVVHNHKPGYPCDNGAHIVIRTIRRFLDNHGEDFERIILCFDSAKDLEVYTRVMALYFPRNLGEQDHAQEALPADTGNELGETVVEERRIPIATMPLVASNLESVVDLEEEEEGMMAFISMAGDHDEARRREETKKPLAEVEAERTELNYQALLKRARKEDFSDIAAMNICYRPGNDKCGRPIIVFVGKHLEVEKVDRERLLLYIIRMMEPMTHKDYVAVYIHTESTSANQPEFAWLRHIYNTVSRRFRKNLRCAYVVHATFFVKCLAFFLQPFVDEKFWERLTYISYVPDIFEFIDEKDLKIPEFVEAYDRKWYEWRWEQYETEQQQKALEPEPVPAGEL